MELLKKRILQDGKCFEGGILKVDSFINHQMDPILMKSIGVEFVRRFANKDFNKVMTIEASGIAPAIMVGYLLELPVVFAKKKQPKTMENMISTTIRSFTKDREYNVCISRDFLKERDRVLFIDDFQNGEIEDTVDAAHSACLRNGTETAVDSAIDDDGHQHGIGRIRGGARHTDHARNQEEDPGQDAGEPAESVDQDESDLPQGAIFIGVAEQPADADDGKEDLGREHSDHDRSL